MIRSKISLAGRCDDGIMGGTGSTLSSVNSCLFVVLKVWICGSVKIKTHEGVQFGLVFYAFLFWKNLHWNSTTRRLKGSTRRRWH